MGFADGIKGAAEGGVESLLGGSGGSQLTTAVAGLLGQDGAGLSALLTKFQASGLGDIAQSWVGKGPNQAVRH